MDAIWTAILVAGGTGSRMGGVLPKQFIALNDIPIIVHTIRKFRAVHPEMPIVVVMHAAYLGHWETLCEKLLSDTEKQHLYHCEGGRERLYSVLNGLNFLKTLFSPDREILVAVHDAVRPFTSPELIETCFETAGYYDSAVPCVPIKSSLRQIIHKGEEEYSIPVSRSDFLEVQTPQIFRLSVLWNCFMARTHDNYTDEASLYQEVSGNPVRVIKGEYYNIKITTPEDMMLGEIILKEGK